MKKSISIHVFFEIDVKNGYHVSKNEENKLTGIISRSMDGIYVCVENDKGEITTVDGHNLQVNTVIN